MPLTPFHFGHAATKDVSSGLVRIVKLSAVFIKKRNVDIRQKNYHLFEFLSYVLKVLVEPFNVVQTASYEKKNLKSAIIMFF